MSDVVSVFLKLNGVVIKLAASRNHSWIWCEVSAAKIIKLPRSLQKSRFFWDRCDSGAFGLRHENSPQDIHFDLKRSPRNDDFGDEWRELGRIYNLGMPRHLFCSTPRALASNFFCA